MKTTWRQWIGGVALLLAVVLLMGTLANDTATATTSINADNNNKEGGKGGWDSAAVTRRRRLTMVEEEEEAAPPPPAETERFHPEKGVLNMKGDEQPIVDPSFPSTNRESSQGTTSSSSMNTNPKRIKEKGEDGTGTASKESIPNNTTTTETTTTTTKTHDENNTAEVSLSVALPFPWNLTTIHPREKVVVNAFVDDVSTAATKLFHTTLDHSITMLDGSPHLPTREEVLSEEKPSQHHHDNNYDYDDDDENHNQDNDEGGPWGGGEGWHYSEASANYSFSSHATPATATSDNNEVHPDDNDETTIWGLPPTTMNHSTNNNYSSSFNFTQVSNNQHPPKEPYDWLGMESLTKEELYKMVLEFLDIDDEEDWHNASMTSPLLRNLKAEIRHAIYGFFFQQQQRQGKDHGMSMHQRNETDGDGSNSSFATDDDSFFFDNYNETTDNTFWIPGLFGGPGGAGGGGTGDQHDADGNAATNGDDNDHPNFKASGLWEMFLKGTRVELVVLQDTYAWWEITMIYPVYVHYQASYDEEVIHNQADLQLDDSVQVPSAGAAGGGGGAASGGGASGSNTNNANVTGEQLEQQQQQSQQQHHQQDGAAGGTSTAAAAAEATENKPYWVPVTDQGTLDFISRLLQRVLEGAVDSGAFLSSLQSLQVTNYHQRPQQHMPDIVGEILALTVPGEEHPIQELISPFDDMEDEMETKEPKGVATQPPMEPPWGSGTYTHGVLDRNDGIDRRQQLGALLLLMTFAVTSGMILMAVWRNATIKQSQEKAWLLGTDEDVAELLQVGWRQYDVSDNGHGGSNNSNSNNHHHRPVDGATDAAAAPQRAEVIEVFDKSREGYYDNDSMLHGSAMQQSHMYGDGCSEVPSAPMEYEKHLERHRGRGEKNMFAALKNDEAEDGGDVDDDDKTKEAG